jgi:hypothetical protein
MNNRICLALLLISFSLLSGCGKEISSKNIELAIETCRNNGGIEYMYPETMTKYGVVVCKNSAIFHFSEETGATVKVLIR